MMRRIHARWLAAVVATLAVFTAAAASEWTRFRGPNGSGLSSATGIPTKWTEQDFLWRKPLPGRGHAQPVIWQDRLFLPAASADGNERMLLCLRASDGTTRWTRRFILPAVPTKNRNSGYANSSPAVDARRVVACFVSHEHFWVRAFDHDGNTLWEHDLGAFDSPHGHGSSPIFGEGRVFIARDQDGESFVAALDIETGALRWQVARRAGGGAAAYGTPALAAGGEELILSSRSHGLSGLDSRSGAMLWECPILIGRTIASPVVAGDLVLATGGQGAAGPNVLAVVRRGGAGDVRATHVAYTRKAGAPCVPTPVVFDGRIYLISDAGLASAIHLASGRVEWSERIGGECFGSPVVIESRVFVPTLKGEMLVLRTGASFELLARNPLGEGTQSSPCVEGSRLWMRTFGPIVCVGPKEKIQL